VRGNPPVLGGEHSTRHWSEKEIKFCKLNRSNPWT
jgi:hypothetical protein